MNIEHVVCGLASKSLIWHKFVFVLRALTEWEHNIGRQQIAIHIMSMSSNSAVFDIRNWPQVKSPRRSGQASSSSLTRANFRVDCISYSQHFEQLNYTHVNCSIYRRNAFALAYMLSYWPLTHSVPNKHRYGFHVVSIWWVDTCHTTYTYTTLL